MPVKKRGGGGAKVWAVELKAFKQNNDATNRVAIYNLMELYLLV
jgi:hypothetical protein